MNKQVMWWVGIVVVLLIVALGWWWYDKEAKAAPSKYDGFAQCLAEKGLTMYGASWCPHCQNEKKNFGNAVKYIKYVECPDNVQLCTSLGIQGYPTWIEANGTKHEGEQGLEGLAKISGCQLPE